MKLRDKIRQLQNPADFWLFIRIAGLTLIMPLLLRWLRLPTLLKILTPSEGVSQKKKEQIEKIVLFTGFILGSRIVGKKTCLKRSLVLYHFLRRAGVDVEIDLGIAKNDTELIGHSWLTYNGLPYLESEVVIKNYQPMFSSKGRE